MDLAKNFEESIKKDKAYQEAVNIVLKNSGEEKVWAVGGIVFRNIVSNLYNSKKNAIPDFDFIVEIDLEKEKLKIPEKWKLTKTSFGDPRIIKENQQIDIWFLNKAVDSSDQERVSEMSTEEKLESYFKRVPLTVQAIAYDIKNKKIVGEKGIKAILDKEIRVNCIRECLNFCKRRKISVRKFIKSKSEDLNFKAFYPLFSDEATKKETEEFYDVYSNEYENQRGGDFKDFMGKNLLEEAKFFTKNLNGTKILDVGSGTGRDALFLKENGLTPVCIDISSAMVEICKKKGLETYKKDIENLDLEEESFDGVWAYTSLLHIPKDRIYNSLARIKEILKEGGLLFLGMVEGNGEKIYRSPNKPKKSRFFALYSDEEIRNALQDYFKIIKHKRFETSRGETYLVYICKKI
jgi:ubiquinone/menaquinone biosynthesis C-methylase UbiE